MKKWKFFGLIGMLVLSMALVFAACSGETEQEKEEGPGEETLASYTVEVLDVDGKPYADATVEAWANGKKVAEIALDKEGTAVFGGTGDKVAVDKTIDEIEVRLSGLPEYLTYSKVTMSRGGSVRIELKEDVSSPRKGTGQAEYKTDVLTGEKSNLLDTDPETFKPFEVETGVYALKFTEKGQKIYFEFQGDTKKAATYSVEALGGEEMAIVHLQGDPVSGIRNMNDPSFEWKTGDKAYEFLHDDSVLQQSSGKSWFEVRLCDAEKATANGYLVLKKVGDYTPEKGPETESVLPEKQPDLFADQEGVWTDAPLDGSLTVVLGADGFYHVGEETGPYLCVTINRTVRGYDVSFQGMYESGQSFTDTDGKTYSKDYYPLLSAYLEKANKDGVYALNEELKEFLNVFLKNGTAKSWLEEQLGELPAGEEWLFACGYYAAEMEGDNEQCSLVFDAQNEIDLPAGKTVLCTLMSMASVTAKISANAENVTMKWYGADPSGEPVTVPPEDGLLAAEFELEGRTFYYVAFENTGKTDLKLSVSLTGTEKIEEGTIDNPIPMEELEGTFTGNSGSDGWGETWYSFIADEEVTITVTADENSSVSVSYLDENEVEHMVVADDFDDGVIKLTLKAGTMYKFLLSSSDMEPETELSFTVETAESGS